MRLHHFLHTPLLALLINAQSFSFPDINIPSIPDPASFATSPDLANGQSSGTSFSSSSSSFSNGRGGSSVSQVSTNCDSDKCETHVNGIVNGTVIGTTTFATSTVTRTNTGSSTSGSSQQSEQTVDPVENGGLLGDDANLATSGTAGSTVVVTGTPTGTARLVEASSEAWKGMEGMVCYSSYFFYCLD